MNENSIIDFAVINEKIKTYSLHQSRLNLEEGKMGSCLYFFRLARWFNDIEYEKLAEKLLDDIFIGLFNETTVLSPSELAQIGMGIDYLLEQKYIKGNVNVILSDLDSLLYKRLSFENVFLNYRIIGIIPTLFFICMRIQQQKKGSSSRFMLEGVSIKFFNDLYSSLDSKFYEEPLLFNIFDYKLPQFLYVVSKMYSLEFYNYRIIEVLKEISGLILSRIPALHANRLYLLWSLVHLKKATGLNTWNEQIDILINYIDYQKIILSELHNKDVFIRDGVTGIYLLLNALKDSSHPIFFDKTLFRKKIEESCIWNDEQAHKNLGFVNGFSGLIWVYSSIVNKE